MRRRQIFLDFTSLLDVIMIILFFFVIFSKIENDDLKKEIEKEAEDGKNAIASEYSEIQIIKNELQIQKGEAEALMDEARQISGRAQQFLDEANEALEQSGKNVEAIIDFNESQNLKINLKMEYDAENWYLSIIKNDKEISRIAKNKISEMTEMLCYVLEKNGYSEEDTVLLEIFYDATESGTTAAYSDMEKMLDQVKAKYRHLFYSETDRSLF